MTTVNRSIILDQESISRKLKRIAYEIYEEHCDQQHVILAGVNHKGYIIAQNLQDILQEISPLQTTLMHVELNPASPNDHPITITPATDLSEQVVIVVDDVANTGRTLLYAVKPFLEYVPASIQTAVLVDRQHKQFPIASDFVGLTLSTTLQEHINVLVADEEIKAVYLD